MTVRAQALNRKNIKRIRGTVERRGSFAALILVPTAFLFSFTGCTTMSGHLRGADTAALNIIQKKQLQALGKTDEFKVERPSDILRRRLLIEQDLPYAGEASLGSDKLKPIAYWPKKGTPNSGPSFEEVVLPAAGTPVKLSLIQALQVGARNSPEYQTRKEEIFRTALALDLERDAFGFTLAGKTEGSYTLDKSGGGGLVSAAAGAGTVEGIETKGLLSLSKTLYNGTRFAATLAMDLVKLLTQSRSSSFGIAGDASISIPLLRGSGRHIVTEPLTQAERNVVYAIYEFERFKKTIAVDITSNYLDVLKQLDLVDNTAENYRLLISSARRTRALADAGQATSIEVGRAAQNELRTRARWITAMAATESRLDRFKQLLGIPTDADIALDRTELDRLKAYARKIVSDVMGDASSLAAKGTSPKNGGITLVPPDREHTGPLEMEASSAIRLGLENRLDLIISAGQVYDAQRSVVVKADALGAEFTLFGRARLGGSRSLATANLANASLSTGRGIYTGLFNLDLPFERTAERNDYRNSYIALERAVREFQKLEDQIKFSIRQSLREMAEAREGFLIQTNAVALAEERVKSTEIFFEAGRGVLRDVTEAQDALLTARNALSAAAVDYRVAELTFQRDTGLLKIKKNGLLLEHNPRGNENGKRK